jgi:hypothetical protein
MRACPDATKTGGSDMALSAAATEFRTTLDALGIPQCRAAQWFGIAPRSLRRWQSGARHVPRAAVILSRLLAAKVITAADVERVAGPVPARTNGDAKPKPAPLLVEPAPEQSALAPTLADPSLTTAEKIVALAPNACRWPYNDPRHPNFHFCSRPTAAPPYCNEHHIAAHMTPRPQQAPIGGQKPGSSRDGTGRPSHDVGGPRAAPVALSV